MGVGYDKLGVDLLEVYYENEKTSAHCAPRYDHDGRYAAVGMARVSNI